MRLVQSSDFLQHVVKPNVEDLSQNRGDIRRAVNAVLSADAFFGIYFHEKRAIACPSVAAHNDDTGFRGKLATQSPTFRVFRDTANSIKHGELTRNHSSRFVDRVGLIIVSQLCLNSVGRWDDAEPWDDNDQGVFVFLSPTGTHHTGLQYAYLPALLREVVCVAGDMVAGTPLRFKELAELTWMFGPVP